MGSEQEWAGTLLQSSHFFRYAVSRKRIYARQCAFVLARGTSSGEHISKLAKKMR
jgi:hypothetical protein